MVSFTEENYLKTIYQLSVAIQGEVSTNSIAEKLDTKASSVTDMLKKLATKELINYKKYQGVTLTDQGKSTAIFIIRKHRLWEVFLVEKLSFKWDEVHAIAEELEHINSNELVERLDKFLGFPQYDPHGDPIPDKDGVIFHHKEFSLADLQVGESGLIVGVKDTSTGFLQYLEGSGLVLGKSIQVVNIYDYDNSVVISIDTSKEATVSEQVSKNLYIKKSLQ